MQFGDAPPVTKSAHPMPMAIYLKHRGVFLPVRDRLDAPKA
jgi:hypothetical protein